MPWFFFKDEKAYASYAKGFYESNDSRYIEIKNNNYSFKHLFLMDKLLVIHFLGIYFLDMNTQNKTTIF